MNNKDFSDLTTQLFADVFKTLDIAYDEYAHDGSQFNNFEQLSKLLKIPREKVWSVYFLKHVFGILAYINGTTEQRETINQRIIDCIGYLTLLHGMVEDE